MKPFSLTRSDTPDAKGRAPTLKLRSMPDQGIVVVDSDTQLSGIPPPPGAIGWATAPRSTGCWISTREKKPRDPTIAARFDTYRLADHKEAMIALPAKVMRVSLETVAITDAMRAASPLAPGGSTPAA